MSQSAQFGDGSNPKIKIKHKLTTGVYENLDDLIELYVYILDNANNTLARYSKSGNDILGNTSIELIRISAFQYKAVLTSALTKTLGTQNLKGEINFVRTDLELATGKSNTTVRFILLAMNDTNIKETT